LVSGAATPSPRQYEGRVLRRRACRRHASLATRAALEARIQAVLERATYPIFAGHWFWLSGVQTGSGLSTKDSDRVEEAAMAALARTGVEHGCRMHRGWASSARGVVILVYRLGISAPGRLRRLSMPSVLLILACGCATGLGPRALRSERPDYNRQIIRSTDAELLLNLVRLRYNDSIFFTSVGGIVAQYAYDAALNAGGTVGRGNPRSA